MSAAGGHPYVRADAVLSCGMAPLASRAHAPVDWFTPGRYPSCLCGYSPRDNEALTAHWRGLGIRWIDRNGSLVCLPADVASWPVTHADGSPASVTP